MRGRSLVLASLLIAAPAALAADDAPLTEGQHRAAYCSGFHAAREQALGDECFEAAAGWENDCSFDERQKSQLWASLAAQQSLANAGPAIVSGQADYKQCISEEAARILACKKQGVAPDSSACTAPPAPACERLRQCDE